MQLFGSYRHRFADPMASPRKLERPKGDNDMMDALRQSVGRDAASAKAAKPAKKSKKASAGQKEMLCRLARSRRRSSPRRGLLGRAASRREA